MKALVVMDNRTGSGMGHVLRCKALVAELEFRNWDVILIGPDETFPERPDVTVLDLKPDIRATVAGPRCVQIVDDVSAIPACVLVINGSAGASPELYAGKVGRARVLAGPTFSLIRKEFAAERTTPRLRNGVLDLRGIAVWNPSDLALEMGSAQVAITYGGMRAMEAACVGTPTVVLPRNAGERLNAEGLLGAGACVVSDESEAQAMAETMLQCPRLLQKMGENARNLVDGKGCKRVGLAITSLME